MPDDKVTSVLELLALPMPGFVDAAYRHLLGRAPNSSEIKAQCGLLRAGFGRVRLLADLGRSAEFRQRRENDLRHQSDGAFLEQVYLRYLGRQIDPQGMNGNLRFLARGKSRERVVCQIAASPEARSRRTLWFELEQLVADERAQRHWLHRWVGRQSRTERSRNRMIEVAQLHSAAPGATETKPVSETGSPKFDLQADAFAMLGADAHRVLARVRQVAIERA